MSKPQPKKSSGFPVIIIVLVAVVAAVIGLVYWNGSRTTPIARNTNGNTGPAANRTPVTPANAPVGAQPPNYLGSANAAVTLEEFADFQCPSCGATHPVMKQIQSLYGQRIKFIFRNFPLPMHDKAYDASAAAEAAGLQGKFWDMHNQLYSNQAAWSSDPNYKQAFKSYAEKIGLDVPKWETDMAGLQARNRVQADMDRAKALNINQTPTVFLNGKPIPYPDMNVPTMQKLIDDEIKAVTQQSAQSTAPVGNTSSSSAGNSAK
jgi:protein-disulfide isomerase